ncbi:MAG: hypothetical protein WC528_03590 [Patescibacteria group bacterium]
MAKRVHLTFRELAVGDRFILLPTKKSGNYKDIHLILKKTKETRIRWSNARNMNAIWPRNHARSWIADNRLVIRVEN